MELKANTEIRVLDSLRAFAALAVCFFHFVCTTDYFKESDPIFKLFYPGAYGVQLFFVISGFIIPWSMYRGRFAFRNFFRFMLKRLARLEPPYIFSLLLAAALILIRQKMKGSDTSGMEISMNQFLLHFGYLIPFFENYKWLNQVYWTLAIEFQYYIFIALLYIPLMRSPVILHLLIYAVLLAAGFYHNLYLLPHWLPSFLMGILLFLFKINKIKSSEYYITTLITIGVALYLNSVYSVMFMITPLIFILYFERLQIPFLNHTGRYSYSVYLLHTLTGAVFLNLTLKFANTFIMKSLLILVAVMITLLCSYLTYLIVEKPSKRLSAGISYK